MSSEFYSKAADLGRHGRSFAVATVVRVEGSSSARRGSKAIIDSQGKLLGGWVGGGCAESAVKTEALRCIEIGQPQRRHARRRAGSGNALRRQDGRVCRARASQAG